MLVEPRAWRIAADHPQWVLPAIAGWLANQGFCAIRFYVLANRAGVLLPFMQALRMTLVGFFVGCVFGGFAANDVARAVWLRQAVTGAALSRILVLLLLDRALGLVAIAAWAFALSFMLPASEAPEASLLVDGIRILCAGLVAALVVLGAIAAVLARKQRADDTSWVARTIRIAGAAAERRVAMGLLLAAAPAFVAAGAVIVAQGYLGMQVAGALGEPPQFMVQAFLAPASLIVSVLPLVPLGIGLGQLMLSGLYALYHLRVDAAVILTTLMQIGQLGVALAAGAPVLAFVRVRSRQN